MLTLLVPFRFYQGFEAFYGFIGGDTSQVRGHFEV